MALRDGVVVDVVDLGAWAGRLLPGWYDDRVLAVRDRLRLLHALEALSALPRDAGRPREAVEAVQAAVTRPRRSGDARGASVPVPDARSRSA